MSFGPKNAKEAAIFAEENLRVDLQHCIQQLLDATGMSRRALAARADMTEAQLSHLFSEDANPTLRTVARLFAALSDECVVTSRRLEAASGRPGRQAEWIVERGRLPEASVPEEPPLSVVASGASPELYTVATGSAVRDLAPGANAKAA